MKKVKILKSGNYNGICYSEDEIWDFVEWFKLDKIAIITRNNKTTKVSMVNANRYGLEAEFIEEDEVINKNILTLW